MGTILYFNILARDLLLTYIVEIATRNNNSFLYIYSIKF